MSSENEARGIHLRNGSVVLQSHQLPLARDTLLLRKSEDWILEIAIPAGQGQTFLNTWQRMIHEPTQDTLFQPNYPGATLPTYDSIDTSKKLRESYAFTGAQYQNAVNYGQSSTEGYFGPDILLVGDSEFGARRVVRVRQIYNIEMAISSRAIETIGVRFYCRGDFHIDAFIHINDGTNGD